MTRLSEEDLEEEMISPVDEGKRSCSGCKGKKPGLWCNICRKRQRGERPAKPGEKGYPKTLNIESSLLQQFNRLTEG